MTSSTSRACSYPFDYRPFRATFATVLILVLSLTAVLASCSAPVTIRSSSGNPGSGLDSTFEVEFSLSRTPWPVYLFSNIDTNLPSEGLHDHADNQHAERDNRIVKMTDQNEQATTEISSIDNISPASNGIPVETDETTNHLPDAVDAEGSMVTQTEAEAEALLKEPDILKVLSDDLAACGLVGEEHLAEGIYLVSFSAKIEEPLHAVVHGPSSTGKTFLVKKVLSFIPDGAKEVLTGLTEQALVYTNGDLDGKVLFIEELFGAAKAEEQLRILQSERGLSRLVSGFGKQGREAIKVSADAAVATITTTTRARIHEENETRALRLASDSSSEQTARVNLETARRRTKSGSDTPDLDRIRRKWHLLFGLIEDIPVVIPHEELLARTFPTHEPRCRRAYGQFVGLIRAITLLHQRTRPTVLHQGEDHLVATTWDIQRAYGLAERFLFPEREAPPAWHQVLAVLRTKGPRTRRQVQAELGVSQSTASRHLQAAEEAGCIERSSGTSPVYSWLREPEGTWELPTEEELEKALGAGRLAQAALPCPEGGGQASNLSEEGVTSACPATRRAVRARSRRRVLKHPAGSSKTVRKITAKREQPRSPDRSPQTLTAKSSNRKALKKTMAKSSAKPRKVAQASAKAKPKVGKSKIEWTDETWNPVTGCTIVGKGCLNCYAEVMARRLQAMGQAKYANGFTVTTHPAALAEPQTWNQPSKVFVCSMGDLFHEDVPTSFIQEVYETMRQCPQHTFQVLTKRPERALELADQLPLLENVWIGTSVENDTVLGRISDLQAVPAAKRFLSLEPLIGPIPHLPLDGIDWVIVGGESGPKFRPMDEDWVREIRDQCVAAGVKFFFKQRAGLHPKKLGSELDGREWKEFPV